MAPADRDGRDRSVPGGPDGFPNENALGTDTFPNESALGRDGFPNESAPGPDTFPNESVRGVAQMRPSSFTASRSDSSSATVAARRSPAPGRAASSGARSGTIVHSPPSEVTGNEEIRPSGTP